jgi:large subunit ribosomal protein L10
VLTRTQKQEQVAELKAKLSRATSVYVADYRGLDVQAVNALRQRMHVEGRGAYEYRVLKNSVLRRAAADSDVAAISDRFRGPTALALSYGDPVALARILVDFAKEHEVFQLKAGVLDGRAIAPAEIGKLATLPSLDALRGKIVGLLVAPATKLVRLVSEPGAQIARVLGARGREER